MLSKVFSKCLLAEQKLMLDKRHYITANKKGNVTRADVTALLHVSPAQAYRLLNRLKENQLLVLEGKGKMAHYRPAK
jgi:Mn-dependent DtxR family transcriptional regulator